MRPGAFLEPAPELPEADGQVAAGDGLVPLVLVADCLPVALAGDDRHRDDPLRLARAGGRDRGARGGGDRAPWRRRWAPASDRAATRSTSRSSPPSRSSAPRWRPTGCSTCEWSRDACWSAPGVEEIEVCELCTSCNPDLFFSHRRDDGRTGRQAGLVWASDERGEASHLMPGLIHGLEAERIRRNLERARERAGDSGRDPGGDQVRAGGGDGGARGGRRDARRREPSPGPSGQAGALGRCLRLGLHRQPPEPEGQGDRPAGAPDPLGGERFGARPAGAPRDARDRGAGRGERRRRARQGRRGSRASSASSSHAARFAWSD